MFDLGQIAEYGQAADKVLSLKKRAASDQDRLFRSMKIECVRVQTGESFVEPLVAFFRKRELRMGR